jgi:hypothetical protein
VASKASMGPMSGHTKCIVRDLFAMGDCPRGLPQTARCVACRSGHRRLCTQCKRFSWSRSSEVLKLLHCLPGSWGWLEFADKCNGLYCIPRSASSLSWITCSSTDGSTTWPWFPPTDSIVKGDAVGASSIPSSFFVRKRGIRNVRIGI